MLERNYSSSLLLLTSSSPTPSTSPIPTPGEDDEYAVSYAILILLSLLILTLIASYVLQRKKITMVHETVIAILAGVIVGAWLNFAPGTCMVYNKSRFLISIYFF